MSVQSRRPPAALMRWAVNPVVRVVADSPVGRLTGALLVLQFAGRHSGRLLRVPVLGHDVAGVPHVFTDARWAANFRHGLPVTVRRGGRQLAGTGTLLDQAEATAALRTVLRTTEPWRLGLRVSSSAAPTDTELTAVRRAIRLELETHGAANWSNRG